ncbi:nucleotide exchange factor GrpE [candidate division KSB1 bacterium]|nr:nucleotide exchange factor GrpE [candidate division KSB1 bacterium]
MVRTEEKAEQQLEEGRDSLGDSAAIQPQVAKQIDVENLESNLAAVTTTAPEAAAEEVVKPELETAGEEEPTELETFVDEHAAGNGVLTLLEQEAETAPAMAPPVDGVSSEQDAEKPKGFFRRRVQTPEFKKLKTDNEKLTAEVETWRERYLRLAADMENFRKRTDRDYYGRVQAEVARMVVAFLPLVDDLERCLNVKDEAREYESLRQGVGLIHQKFNKVLSGYGVAPMQAEGKEFDPNLHDALTEMVSAGKPAGLVLEEHCKGYMLRDKVLRPAKVVVSK